MQIPHLSTDPSLPVQAQMLNPAFIRTVSLRNAASDRHDLISCQLYSYLNFHTPLVIVILITKIYSFFLRMPLVQLTQQTAQGKETTKRRNTTGAVCSVSLRGVIRFQQKFVQLVYVGEEVLRQPFPVQRVSLLRIINWVEVLMSGSARQLRLPLAPEIPIRFGQLPNVGMRRPRARRKLVHGGEIIAFWK